MISPAKYLAQVSTMNNGLSEMQTSGIPWKIATAFLTLVQSFLLSTSISAAFDHMSISLFAFVVELDHKVW
jgi:hypothetical protein